MTAAPRPTLSNISQADLAALLALNNADHALLSWIDTQDALAALCQPSFYAKKIIAPSPQDHAAPAGMLIAFTQDAPYASPNFKWFCAREERFVYIDRVVISAAARGQGLARHLYEDLAATAKAAGHRVLCCEVNLLPENPASHAFHHAQGFRQCGSATLATNAQGTPTKQVAYYQKNLID